MGAGVRRWIVREWEGVGKGGGGLRGQKQIFVRVSTLRMFWWRLIASVREAGASGPGAKKLERGGGMGVFGVGWGGGEGKGSKS